MHFSPRGSPERGPLVMGILNVTPDSFSDGGRWSSVGSAVAHALEMRDRGADIIDIGAESTRPGHTPVPAEEEVSRLAPVLRALRPVLDIPISVDTMKAEVAEECIALGADMINDVNGLRGEGMAEVCASHGVHVVVMHSPSPIGEVHSGEMGPGFAEEIRSSLLSLAERAEGMGVRRGRIVLDPGIGFGKTNDQNRWIIENSSYFSCGYPVLSASSRKRCISHMYPGEDIDDASADAARIAWESGADIVRVHDVARTVAAVRREGSRRR